MRKRTVIFAVLILLLAACRAATGEATPPGSSPTPAATPAETGASAPSAHALPAMGLPMTGCTVATLLPQADPTVESLFPPVSEADWSAGPEEAAVTLVEYGDFQ